MSNPVVPTAKKRSLKIGGHATSVRLEDAFWEVLIEIANRRILTITELIEKIDEDRNTANLSSHLRVYALRYVRARSLRRQHTPEHPDPSGPGRR